MNRQKKKRHTQREKKQQYVVVTPKRRLWCTHLIQLLCPLRFEIVWFRQFDMTHCIPRFLLAKQNQTIDERETSKVKDQIMYAKETNITHPIIKRGTPPHTLYRRRFWFASKINSTECNMTQGFAKIWFGELAHRNHGNQRIRATAGIGEFGWYHGCGFDLQNKVNLRSY